MTYLLNANAKILSGAAQTTMAVSNDASGTALRPSHVPCEQVLMSKSSAPLTPRAML